jgi:hypothetical protein
MLWSVGPGLRREPAAPGSRQALVAPDVRGVQPAAATGIGKRHSAAPLDPAFDVAAPRLVVQGDLRGTIDWTGKAVQSRPEIDLKGSILGGIEGRF